MKSLTIGRLAKQAGVNLETVRFYERRGLLPRPPRSASGYRLFPAEAARRLLNQQLEIALERSPVHLQFLFAFCHGRFTCGEQITEDRDGPLFQSVLPGSRQNHILSCNE